MTLPDAVRARLKEAAFAAGVGEPLRRIKRAVEPRHIAQDRRDLEHLRAILAAVLAPDADCVDVGAHRGAVLADCLRLAPAGRHVAYEPLPDLAAELARAFPAVDVHATALADHAGEESFVHVVSRPGWSGFRERPYPGEEQLERITVRTETLDASLPAGLAPAFIKIDVEGAELGVLRGGIETIARHRPVIAFEHGLGAADVFGTTPADVWDLLSGEPRLRIFDMDGGGPYGRSEFEEAFWAGKRVNWLARV